ncbi:MAG: SH3 domain-containing protein, partial [Anaerolineae bacterium]
MRLRIWILIVAALVLAACTGARGSRQVVYTPAPLKTLRPTFTATPEKTRPPATPAPVAAATAVPTSAPAAATPAPTPVPPSPTAVPPTPTAEKASFTVSSPGTTNVRLGPGTSYPIIGEVQQGQKFEITGKNQ